MKFLEIFNIRIPVSNEEKKLYKKIKKKNRINADCLNEREKFLIRQLLNKNLVGYKIEGENIIYYSIS